MHYVHVYVCVCMCVLWCIIYLFVCVCECVTACSICFLQRRYFAQLGTVWAGLLRGGGALPSIGLLPHHPNHHFQEVPFLVCGILGIPLSSR